jgi:hypothetical protein
MNSTPALYVWSLSERTLTSADVSSDGQQTPRLDPRALAENSTAAHQRFGWNPADAGRRGRDGVRAGVEAAIDPRFGTRCQGDRPHPEDRGHVRRAIG